MILLLGVLCLMCGGCFSLCTALALIVVLVMMVVRRELSGWSGYINTLQCSIDKALLLG